jgi:hypothetical protein
MGKNFKASTKLTAKFLIALLVVQAALFAFTAFADTKPTAVTIHEKNATGADVSGKTINIFKGAFTLAAVPDTAVTTNAYKVNYWKSSVGSVITVSTGNTAVKSFTAAAKGTTTLTVFNTTDSTGPTNTVTVNVYSKLTGFTFPDAGKLTVKLGQAGYIKEPTLIPADADVTETVYSLSAAEITKGVVKVNTTDGTNTVAGAVYAVKSGTAVVTVTKTLPGNTKVTKTFTVTVPEPVQSLAISADGRNPAPDSLYVNLGKKTTLKAILTAATAGKKSSNIGVTWTKESGGDAGLDINAKGEVQIPTTTADSLGKTAVFRVTANDSWNNAYDTVTVTVGKELKTFSVTQSSVFLKSGGTKQINTILKSDNAAIAPSVTSVTYVAEPNKTDILTVDKDTGLITANTTKTSGTVNIVVTATPADGSAPKKVTVKATIVADVSTITLSTTVTAAKPLSLYSKTNIKAVIDPAALKLNAVRYKAADESIVFVNPYTGEVTGLKAGSTTITAKADGKISNEITIFVADPLGLQQ